MISKEEAIRKAEESAVKVNMGELRNNTLAEEVTNNKNEDTTNESLDKGTK